ncbi:hypothetical protein ACQE3D_09660 [Methylomonas sp. MS20]|uniref:hypothetical protein n=1 Tax=unclassified Methylomonas TaxID=2608980 RepID=UPI0028A533F7|nr:hypothetical protein [Methylomonas sp. MV1]MDT4328735.1 hypothetical protein [Methylomonas sp. MV1]
MREQHASQTISARSITLAARVKLPSGLKPRKSGWGEPRKIQLSTAEVRALRSKYFAGPIDQFLSIKQNLCETSNIEDVIASLRGVKKAIVDYANTSIRDVLTTKLGTVFVRSPGDFGESFNLKPNMKRLESAMDGSLFNLASIEADFHQNDGYVETTRIVMFLQIIWRLIDFVDREIREFEAKEEAGLCATEFTSRKPQTVDLIVSRLAPDKKKPGKSKKVIRNGGRDE